MSIPYSRDGRLKPADAFDAAPPGTFSEPRSRFRAGGGHRARRRRRTAKTTKGSSRESVAGSGITTTMPQPEPPRFVSFSTRYRDPPGPARPPVAAS